MEHHGTEHLPFVKKIPTWSHFPTNLLPGLLYLDHTCSRCITRKRWRVREIEVTSCRFRSVKDVCIYIYVSANFYSSTHVSPTFLWHGNVLKGHHQNQVKHGEARTGWDAAPLAAKASWCARESWKIPVRNLAQETSMFFGKQNSVPCFRKGTQFHLVHTPIQPIQHQ